MCTLLTEEKQRMIDALADYKGIVSDACRRCGICRTTHYKWMKLDAEYKEAVNEVNEQAIDFVESKLLERITGVSIGKFNADGELVTYELPPDNTAIIFFLKCKAKNRGYVERQEIITQTVPDINLTITGTVQEATDLYDDTTTTGV